MILNSVTWGEDRMNAIELATLSIAQRAMETGVGDVGTLAQAGIQAFNEGVNIPGLNSETQSSLSCNIGICTKL